MNPLGFLWEKFQQLGRLGLAGFLFPEPVADATLTNWIPPAKDNKLIYLEKGQCATTYRVRVKVETYINGTPANIGVRRGWSSSVTVSGPITFLGLRGRNGFPADFGCFVNSVGIFGGGAPSPTGPVYGQSHSWKPVPTQTFKVEILDYEIVRVDNLPDNCPPQMPPASDSVRGAFVPAPVPVPVLPPPLVSPPQPFPRRFPDPFVPNPLPTPNPTPTPVSPPANPPAPTFNIDIDVLDVDIEVGKAFDWTPFFLALAGQNWLLFLQLWGVSKKIDQVLQGLECLLEKFCLEYKEGLMVGLGVAGYDRFSTISLLLQNRPNWKPKILHVQFQEVKPSWGRRIRPRVSPLFSDPTFGYLSWVYKTGAYGEKKLINFAYSAFPVPEDVIAVAVWIEPSAGEGRVSCWFERFVREV